jgi:xanthine dehydrogenase accessory factor
MNDNEYTARTMTDQLASGSAAVLVSIISLEGSSPRHSGTKMVVGKGGTYGTIGGSLVEAAAIVESRRSLRLDRSKLMEFDLGGEDPSASAMVCGGMAEILLDVVPPTTDNVEFFKSYLDLVMKGRDFYFLTVFGDDSENVVVLGHSVLQHDGALTGTYAWDEEHVQALKSELHNISSTELLTIGDITVVVDPIRKTKTLYCFGAGHVAVPTAHIAALVGFRVVVLDDRAEYANTGRFPNASQVRVIEDFGRALEGLSVDSDSYIVIVTRGHRYDRIVLEQALSTKAGYIGMISSRQKRDAIYSALTEQGVSRDQLERVHAPIGLRIGGETPEEIAVSIVAELIQERARQQA